MTATRDSETRQQVQRYPAQVGGQVGTQQRADVGDRAGIEQVAEIPEIVVGSSNALGSPSATLGSNVVVRSAAAEALSAAGAPSACAIVCGKSTARV